MCQTPRSSNFDERNCAILVKGSRFDGNFARTRFFREIDAHPCERSKTHNSQNGNDQNFRQNQHFNEEQNRRTNSHKIM